MAKIQHRHNRQYTVINNHIYEDRNLKLSDIGLFDLLYHFPEDWNFREVDLAKRTSSGRTALRTSLKKLEKFGYLRRERTRNKKGQLVSTNWILDDEGKLGDNSISKSKKEQNKTMEKPLSDTPTTEKQLLEKPSLDNNLLQSTIPTKYSVSSSKHASTATQTDQKFQTKKQAESSLDDLESVSKAYNLWKDIWGKPSEFVKKQISQWVAEFGLDVVLHAFNYSKWKVERASSAGSYLAKVFSNYRQNNVKTISQADTADKDNLNQPSQGANQPNKTDPPEQYSSSKSSSSKEKLNPEDQVCYRKAIEAGIKLTPSDQTQLALYIHKLGKEVVLYGINVAKRETRYKHPSWGFLNSILNRCLTQGVTKPETRKKATPTYKKRKVIEHTPDWLYKDPTAAELKKSSPQALATLHKRLAEYKAKKLAGGSTT